MNRRPIFARDYDISTKLALWLSQKKITPNQISVLGVIFSFIAFALMICCKNSFILSLGIIILLLGRLLANMMDGMVAIEYNKKTFDGPLYNEIPDRISDMLTFMGMGFYALSVPGLICGGLASSLALFTAYIRAFGGSLGYAQTYDGLGQKSNRIFIACFFLFLGGIFSNGCITFGLLVISILSLETCITRLLIIYKQMKEHSGDE